MNDGAEWEIAGREAAVEGLVAISLPLHIPDATLCPAMVAGVGAPRAIPPTPHTHRNAGWRRRRQQGRG